MDCNKEEAIRAKGIAEKKMQNKDFDGARKIALKAKLLYKDLENISQMIMVCDVHCSAVKKLAGNEMDWYDILQIEQTADEATIKKQYRKFALLLHPDKNKFPGAEAAFKLIGEAQRVLLDKGKRSLFDVKRRAYVSKPAPAYRSQQSTSYSQNVGVQNNYRNNSTVFNSQHQQQAGQQEFSNGRATFWTACPFCLVKYQYYVQVMNKALICQSCNKPFVAYERAGTATPTGAAKATNLNQSTFPQKKDVLSQGFCQGNSNAEHSQTEFQKKVGSSELNSQKVNGKRQRKEAESSESCDTENSIDTRDAMEVDEDGDFTAGVDVGCHGERPRRSDWRKQHVSYKESQSDDEDFPGHPKKAKWSGSSCAIEEENGNGLKEDLFETNKKTGLASGVKDHNGEKKKEVSESLPNEEKATKNMKGKEKAEVNGYKETSEAHIDSASNSSSKSTSDPELYEYPDPEFYDFDKGRAEGCFSVGQIWAVYDTFDAMPRFYVRIRKVYSPEFKLRITWLEPDPDDEDEIGWVNEGLPVSCGKFKLGFSEYTEDRLMFSHMVIWEKGSQRDTFKIYPRKGEIWAIFKNWDVKWKSDAFSNQEYEYEFVEILSEFTEGVGLDFAYLGKLKGFVSVFCRISKGGNATFQIPAGELFRFAYMIPSFKLTGQERQGVPKGSFELDPASLPKNIEEIAVPEDLVVEVGNNHLNGSFSGTSVKVKSEIESEASISGHRADVNTDLESEVDNVNVDHSAPPASTSDAIEIPEPLFFNFDAGKSIDKFEVGQIWSLYSDEDGLPKYYGRITKVASDQCFKLQLRWLIACAMPNDVICWHDKDMPICCGRFKTKKGKSQTYTSNSSFSHQLSAEPADKKNEYIILPRKGQVWALYKNWSAEIKCCDLVNCEYDVVEVLEENALRIKVSFLEQVDGFNSVFKAQFKQGSAVSTEILNIEMLRFSHQIPAFKLTAERNGSLRGFWELDPAALPVHYFTK